MKSNEMVKNQENYNSANSDSQTWPQYLAACLATLTAVVMGSHLAWSSSAILILKSNASEIPITDGEGSWIGSLITLGACFGAIPGGVIISAVGPKRALQLIALPFLAAWLLIAFGGSVWALYLARIMAGLSSGACCVAAPLYVAELAEAKIRGTLGTFFQLQITVGLLIGYTLGGTIQDFKLLALISSSVPIVFLLTFSFMPESPVFLSEKGQIEEARKSLQFFRGKQCYVEDELNKIRQSIKETAANQGGFMDLFRCKAAFRALIISLALMFFQQMCGINAVLFYAESIFKQSGSNLSSSVCTIVVGVVQVIATYLASLLIDRLGRKILLIISGSLMGICLGVLGIYFHFKQLQYDVSQYSLAPLTSVAIYIVVFSIGFGPIPWMITGEIFSSNVKGAATSVAATFNWNLAFAVTKLFQPVQEVLGLGLTFGVFGMIAVVGATFTIIMVPETKGRDLQEVQRILLGEKFAKPIQEYKINDGFKAENRV